MKCSEKFFNSPLTLQDDAISREEHHLVIGCVHSFNGLGGVNFGGGALKPFLKHHESI